VDKILIFAVLKTLLLQQREAEGSFIYTILEVLIIVKIIINGF